MTVLSGVIIGVQMLTDFCGKLKFTKNLILITDGERTTDYTDAEAVANQINTQGIKFSALLVPALPIIHQLTLYQGRGFR